MQADWTYLTGKLPVGCVKKRRIKQFILIVMKKLSKIKLTQLAQSELNERELGRLLGGTCSCLCGCTCNCQCSCPTTDNNSDNKVTLYGNSFNPDQNSSESSMTTNSFNHSSMFTPDPAVATTCGNYL